MQRRTPSSLRVGDWSVDATSGEISRNGETARLEVRTLRLLLCLAEHAGEVVSIDDLLDQVWSGVNVTPDSVYQAVATLRRLLGDDPRQPAYIATVPRLGYRLLAPVHRSAEPPGPAARVSHVADEGHPAGSTTAAPRPSRNRAGLTWAAGVVLCLALVVALLLYGKNAIGRSTSTAIAQPTQRSVAVLPFLDLTEGMKEEEFADGMTEELIDKLSQIPGLRVPAPTSSFYYKNKKIPVGEIARTLGVAYVLDGSVRKSGARVRVAARLIRPDNGYVVWSESYDRPWADLLTIQDEIANEVTKALKASIDATSVSGR